MGVIPSFWLKTVFVVLSAFFSSAANADCFGSNGSNSCWKRVDFLDNRPVATVSKATAEDAIETTEKFGLNELGASQGGVAFLRNQITRMSGWQSFSFFPGAEECNFFNSEFPAPGQELSVVDCEAIIGSVVNILTLHYICEEPNALTRGFTENTKQCPYRVANGQNWNATLRDALAETAIATAALTQDDSLFETSPWSQAFINESEWREEFVSASAVGLNERFVRYRNARRVAQAAAYEEYFSASEFQIGQISMPVVNFVVGNKFSSRSVEAGELFSALASRQHESASLNWETGYLEPFQFARSICANQFNGVKIALVDASAYDALANQGCADKAIPVARVGSEDFAIAANLTKKMISASSDEIPLWNLRASVGIAGKTPDGASSSDQMFLTHMRENFDQNFGADWNLVEYQTGGLAAEALANGSVDLTISNPFEVIENVVSKSTMVAALTERDAVPLYSYSGEGLTSYFGDWETSTVDWATTNIARRPNAANNYYLVVTGDSNPILNQFVADISRIVTVSPEWRAFLAKHFMTDVDPQVEGVELQSLEEYFRP